MRWRCVRDARWDLLPPGADPEDYEVAVVAELSRQLGGWVALRLGETLTDAHPRHATAAEAGAQLATTLGKPLPEMIG